MSIIEMLKGKQNDPRWLQLEICRDFQRKNCPRSETECKYCHCETEIEVKNGYVTACYDSIRGRCNRKKPKCKYFHPPEHLRQQLLINGKKYLELKNAIVKQVQMGQNYESQQVVVPPVPLLTVNPYLLNMQRYCAAQPLYSTTNQIGISSPSINYGINHSGFMLPMKNPQYFQPISCQNYSYPNMFLIRKSAEYKPSLLNTLTTDTLAYLKPSNHFNTNPTHSKIFRGTYDKKFKK